jgi:hypothetical protein
MEVLAACQEMENTFQAGIHPAFRGMVSRDHALCIMSRELAVVV